MQVPLTEWFGGEERRFLVLNGQLRAIQTKCGDGPGAVAQRLARCVQVLRQFPDATIMEQVALGLGELRPDDVAEPIFQGLVAAGMNPNDAGKLRRIWIEDRGFQGLVENASLALVVLVAGQAIPTGEETDLGEPKAGATTAAPPPKSTSESSIAPAGPSASAHGRSTKQASGSLPKRSRAGSKHKAAKKKSNRPAPQSTTA